MTTIEGRRGFADDPLHREQQRHAETIRTLERTTRELEETKRALTATAVRAYEQTNRALNLEAVDAIIDVALERGQIVEAQRDAWRRKFERSPSATIVELAGTARGSVEAQRAFWEAEDTGYEREMRGRLGFDGELL